MVNADSMQLYRGMDIGTAKLTRPSAAASRTTCSTSGTCARAASVADYQLLADDVLAELAARHRRRSWSAARALRPRPARRPRLPGHRSRAAGRARTRAGGAWSCSAACPPRCPRSGGRGDCRQAHAAATAPTRTPPTPASGPTTKTPTKITATSSTSTSSASRARAAGARSSSGCRGSTSARAGSAGSSRPTTTSLRTWPAVRRLRRLRGAPRDPRAVRVCFRHLPGGRAAALRLPPGQLDAHQDRLQRALEVSGDGWLTTTRLRGATYLRAGIVNYLSTEDDIDQLLETLRRLAAG